MDCCLSIRNRATSRIISAFRISPPAKKADKKAVSVFVHQFYVVTIHLLDSTGCCISPTITICRLTTYQLHFGSNSKFNMLVSCQEGWHRPALSLFIKVFCVFSCILPKVACFQKFAFAKRSRAMKAPVGLLSDRTVLRSKMEGPRPDKFAFAKRSAAMKAPVGLLSDRTVLRSKMEGPRPDKFTFFTVSCFYHWQLF